MIEMPSTGHTVAAYATSTLAIAGGVVAQAAPRPGVGDAGLYVGAGGLFAALALLVSSMGDKLGPHAVAVVKLLVENSANNAKLRGENLTLAQRILDLEGRLTAAEGKALEAARKANEAEDIAIALRARAEVIEGRVTAAHRKADAATRKGVDNANRLDAVEVATGSGSGSGEVATPPEPPLPLPLPLPADPHGSPSPPEPGP